MKPNRLKLLLYDFCVNNERLFYCNYLIIDLTKKLKIQLTVTEIAFSSGNIKTSRATVPNNLPHYGSRLWLYQVNISSIFRLSAPTKALGSLSSPSVIFIPFLSFEIQLQLAKSLSGGTIANLESFH